MFIVQCSLLDFTVCSEERVTINYTLCLYGDLLVQKDLQTCIKLCGLLRPSDACQQIWRYTPEFIFDAYIYFDSVSTKHVYCLFFLMDYGWSKVWLVSKFPTDVSTIVEVLSYSKFVKQIFFSLQWDNENQFYLIETICRCSEAQFQ